MLSRCCLPKPSNEKLTEYVPTGRLVSRYCPAASVVAERVFSMSAGLVTSTSTPGITPPCASRTVPAIWPCWAKADIGRRIRSAATSVTFTQRDIAIPLRGESPPRALVLRLAPQGVKGIVKIQLNHCKNDWDQRRRNSSSFRET